VPASFNHYPFYLSHPHRVLLVVGHITCSDSGEDRVSPVEHSNLKEIMSELFSLLTSIDTGRGMLRDALGSSSSMRLAW
jgi:hypothetical protein